MSWDSVRSTLARACALMENPALGEAWLDELPHIDDGDLLGFCLAIDVVSGATSEQFLADVLNALPAGSDARTRFYESVNGRSGTVRCKSQLFPADPPADVYVRILELGQFIEFYLRPDYGYTTDPADIATVRRLFLRPTPRPMGDILQPWSGNHEIIWVLPQSVATEILESAGGVADLADRLGLALNGGIGHDGGLELVAIIYPAAFETEHGTRCRQPTSFDANWKTPGTLYVSHGREDDWGRTRSCSGTRPGLQERVHPAIERLTDQFLLTSVGVTPPPAVNRSAIVREAESRFDSASKKQS